jgi:DNA-binding MarR family transcriptional regulator
MSEHPTNGLNDVVHQRHLTVLVEAGLLDMEKGYDGKRPKTWVSITRSGRQALADEIAALRALVARHTG